MILKNSKKAYLLLEDGTVFEGKSFGSEGEIISEISFSTSSTGYQEALSDTANYKQIIAQTFPLIGNYGVNSDDYQSDFFAGGYVVREYCEMPSNFRSTGNINEFLKKHNIIGIYGIDTRALTRRLRNNGEMNAAITTSVPSDELLNKIKNYKTPFLVKEMSSYKHTKFTYEYAKYNLAFIDYGYRKGLLDKLISCGCNITIYPYDVAADEIVKGKYDGIVLSGGVGDPQELDDSINTLKKLINNNIPVFGVNFGHLIYALANGAKIEKMRYGHRGENHPVVDTENNIIYIAAQNHGYVVVNESVNEFGKVVFINGNDGSCEGIEYKDGSFTVQFNPEACGGPLDTEFLFERFLKVMEEKRCR